MVLYTANSAESVMDHEDLIQGRVAHCLQRQILTMDSGDLETSKAKGSLQVNRTCLQRHSGPFPAANRRRYSQRLVEPGIFLYIKAQSIFMHGHMAKEPHLRPLQASKRLKHAKTSLPTEVHRDVAVCGHRLTESGRQATREHEGPMCITSPSSRTMK